MFEGSWLLEHMLLFFLIGKTYLKTIAAESKRLRYSLETFLLNVGIPFLFSNRAMTIKNHRDFCRATFLLAKSTNNSARYKVNRIKYLISLLSSFGLKLQLSFAN